MENELINQAKRLGRLFIAAGKKLAAAESCTGGWIAQTVTSIPGSSKWFDRGFVTYSNASKIQMLGVSNATLEQYGAVSAETVKEMAAGALRFSDADYAIAVSGIAGPDGGSEEKPVGTVYLASQQKGKQAKVSKHVFSGNRQEIRRKAVLFALQLAAGNFAIKQLL